VGKPVNEKMILLYNREFTLKKGLMSAENVENSLCKEIYLKKHKKDHTHKRT
jgi:hypothetical protein